MRAYYLVCEPGPLKRAYFKDRYNEKSWWLPYRYDVISHAWIAVRAHPISPAIMPTPYRTLEDAIAARDALKVGFAVVIVDAQNDQRVEEQVAS